MKVNFVDLKKQCAIIGSNGFSDELTTSLMGGAFMGSQEFEEKFAAYHGAKYCVGVGSGTDALLLSLLALGVGPGDQVVVPANTYIATAFAVSHTGATPIFIDPDPNTYVLTVDNLYKVVTNKTKAIIPVHLYGHPADMTSLVQFAKINDIFIVEDCAQSAGAQYKNRKTGTWGDVGAYSFYPTKNLGGLAQGGAIVTNNEYIARTVRELGNVGRTDGSWFDYSHIGFNSRLDAINAKFLSKALDSLDGWNEARSTSAFNYIESLADIKQVKVPQIYKGESKSVFHLFELKCESKEIRDSLKKYLESNNIGCGLHYPVPCHLQPIYINSGGYCHVAEELSNTLLSLPMHPFLTKVEIKYVCDKIKDFYYR